MPATIRTYPKPDLADELVTIPLNVAFPKSFLSDVESSGGYGTDYWCSVRWLRSELATARSYVAIVTVSDTEEKHKLSRDWVRKGLRALASKHPIQFAKIVHQGYADKDDMDSIFQCAVLGEIVFG